MCRGTNTAATGGGAGRVVVQVPESTREATTAPSWTRPRRPFLAGTTKDRWIAEP